MWRRWQGIAETVQRGVSAYYSESSLTKPVILLGEETLAAFVATYIPLCEGLQVFGEGDSRDGIRTVMMASFPGPPVKSSILRLVLRMPGRPSDSQANVSPLRNTATIVTDSQHQLAFSLTPDSENRRKPAHN